jgi:hypothetical protein
LSANRLAHHVDLGLTGLIGQESGADYPAPEPYKAASRPTVRVLLERMPVPEGTSPMVVISSGTFSAAPYIIERPTRSEH